MKRESNIELLRIVAMLLVLLLHANYFSLGDVKLADVERFPLNSFCKAFAEQLCIICVNVFVLISGWFGIKPSLRGGLSLLFQVYFFHGLIVLFYLCIGITVPLRTIIIGFYFGRPYWFIIAYFILYAISPILNAFIQIANPRTFLSVLASFFIMEFAYGWITDVAAFNGGYTAISFVGLYLLAQFIRKYSCRLLKIGVFVNLLFYVLLSILPVILFFLSKHKFNMIAYSSPFVIMASLFFFLAFNKMKISNKAINYLACSSLSIYLVHLHPLISEHFIFLMNLAYNTLGGFSYVLFVFIFAICFGLFCILLDKIRILLWSFLCKSFLDSALCRFQVYIDRIYTRLNF